MKRILIAGIGNIFYGDDAFGVEIVRELSRCEWPEDVQIVDFGIRAYDLAYAFADGYETIILVDAVPRGQPPGTVYLIEPELNGLEKAGFVANGHSLNPISVLQMAISLGGQIGRLYLVGCEPAVLECKEGQMGLSGPVAAAVPQAVEIIQSLVDEMLSGRELALTERS
jgi:hydrogenase maturation protease